MQFSNDAWKKIRNEKMHKADKDLEYFTFFHFHVCLQNKSCSIFAMDTFSSEMTKNNILSLIVYLTTKLLIIHICQRKRNVLEYDMLLSSIPSYILKVINYS